MKFAQICILVNGILSNMLSPKWNSQKICILLNAYSPKWVAFLVKTTIPQNI